MVPVQVFKVELEQGITHVRKKAFKHKIVPVLVTPVVEHVSHGENGERAMLHVIQELKVEIDPVVLIKDVLIQPRIDHVILVSNVQIAQLVKIGPNGAYVVQHVVQEPGHVVNHVVIQVARITLKPKTVTLTAVRSFVKTIAIHGVHGHPAVLLVTVVSQQDHVLVRRLLKMRVSHQKIKIVEQKHVHRTLACHALDQMALGLNGGSAVKHVVVGPKAG